MRERSLLALRVLTPISRKNAHDGFHPQQRWFGKDYSAFTDYLGHKDLGEKTILFYY